MASIAKILSLFFLFTLLSSLQIHARDSQFFSKVTRDQFNTETKPQEAEPIKPQESEPVKLQEVEVTKPEEQEPAFIPQTTQNGYGLYGHETGQFPPSTTTTAETRTRFQDPVYTPAATTPSTTATTTSSNNNNYMYNMDAFEPKREGNTKETQNAYYPNFDSNAEKNYSPELQGSKYNYNSNGEKEGMSDTRFLENGRYFYDVNTENNVPRFEYPNPGRSEYFNNNNNKYNRNSNLNGYYGSNENFNNNNNNQYKNGMQSYNANQEEQEEEFEFEP